MDLNNKKVLVTGATSGLGLELATQLAESGAIVIGLSRNSNSSNKIPKSLTDNPAFQSLELDLANSDYDSALKPVKSLDILINNAGLYYKGDFTDMSDAQIENLISINLLAPIKLTRALLPKILSSSKGKIVSVNSVSIFDNKPQRIIYQAAKTGLRKFYQGLRTELESTNIQILEFFPGGIDTPIFEKAGVQKPNKELLKPENVAKLILNTIKNSNLGYIKETVIDKV